MTEEEARQVLKNSSLIMRVKEVSYSSTVSAGYIISQSPADIPNEILAQLGNKVQHTLRAYTPAEQKVIKAVADSFRTNPEFNTEEAISRFAKKLRKMGVDEELEKMGVQEGDIIKILDYEFEYTK